MILKVLGMCVLVVFGAKAQNGKVCFDCTGASGSHVRTPRERCMGVLFSRLLEHFSSKGARVRFFIDFGYILVRFWRSGVTWDPMLEALGDMLGRAWRPSWPGDPRIQGIA